MTDAARDYDWEDYAKDFVPSDAYAEQEKALEGIFQTLAPVSILEVGPGLGRITRLALQRWPMAEYSAADIAVAPLAEAQRLSGGLVYEFHGSIADAGALMLQALGVLPQFDLVLAIEVLMHVPPEGVWPAVENLLQAVKPDGGHLITCDWTKDYGDTEIRVSNYRHDYMTLFHRAGARTIQGQSTGAQTIYVVQPWRYGDYEPGPG